jgi:hypothetical protein
MHGVDEVIQFRLIHAELGLFPGYKYLKQTPDGPLIPGSMLIYFLQ